MFRCRKLDRRTVLRHPPLGDPAARTCSWDRQHGRPEIGMQLQDPAPLHSGRPAVVTPGCFARTASWGETTPSLPIGVSGAEHAIGKDRHACRHRECRPPFQPEAYGAFWRSPFTVRSCRRLRTTGPRSQTEPCLRRRKRPGPGRRPSSGTKFFTHVDVGDWPLSSKAACRKADFRPREAQSCPVGVLLRLANVPAHLLDAGLIDIEEFKIS